eukprot:SAG31_NODE_1618_length_7732_cov_28.468361_3_plen_152_part_00
MAVILASTRRPSPTASASGQLRTARSGYAHTGEKSNLPTRPQGPKEQCPMVFRSNSSYPVCAPGPGRTPPWPGTPPQPGPEPSDQSTVRGTGTVQDIVTVLNTSITVSRWYRYGTGSGSPCISIFAFIFKKVCCFSQSVPSVRNIFYKSTV